MKKMNNSISGEEDVLSPYEQTASRNRTTFLYTLPERARRIIMLMVGIKECGVVSCLNKDHEHILLDDSIYKPLFMQRWNPSTVIQTCIDREKKMAWFDFGAIMLSLLDEMQKDIFPGREIPRMYEDLWVEERLIDFFQNQDNVQSLQATFGISFQFLIGAAHYDRIIQNALAPQTVHNESEFRPPDFTNEIVFFGHHSHLKQSTFLGFWIGDNASNDYKLDHCPIIEWCYWTSRIEIVYLNFEHMLTMGGQVSYVAPESVEHTKRLHNWLSLRQIKAPELVRTQLQKPEDNLELVSLIETYFPRKLWKPKLTNVLERALEKALPRSK